MNNSNPIKQEVLGMNIEIPEKELMITAARGSGSGGQKRNKTSTKIHIDFDVLGSEALTQEQKDKVLQNSARLTTDRHLVFECDETRSQHKNKEIAHQRLNEYLSKLLTPKKKRKKVKKSRAVLLRERSEREKLKQKKRERRIKL